MVSETAGDPMAAKRDKHRETEWSASFLEAGPSMWAAQGTKFEGKYQIKTKFFYSPTDAQVIVLKTMLKFTLKQLRHVSVQSHHLQGVHYPCLLKFFFFPGATTPIGGCILQPSSGL